MEKEPMAALIGETMWVQAFIPEFDRERVRVGGTGLFYPTGRDRKAVRLRIKSIENHTTREIVYPELASVYNGPLPAQRMANNRLEPEQAVYRVICEVESDAPRQLLVGWASIEAEPRNLISDIWRRFLGLLIRESDI